MINTLTPPPLPTSVFIMHRQAEILGGGDLVFALNGNQHLNGAWIQSPYADGDSFQYTFPLAPGTYTMEVCVIKRSLNGMLDWELDGVEIATGDDLYDASTLVRELITHTGIVVNATHDGLHTLKGTINGKHASSTNYRADITYVALVKE